MFIVDTHYDKSMDFSNDGDIMFSNICHTITGKIFLKNCEHITIRGKISKIEYCHHCDILSTIDIDSLSCSTHCVINCPRNIFRIFLLKYCHVVRPILM